MYTNRFNIFSLDNKFSRNIIDFIICMNDVKINIVDDMAKNNGGTLAGSIKLISDMAKRLVSETKIKFKDFIRFSSTNPAQNLGVESRYQIKTGSKPNFMIWDKNLKPEKTFNA